MPLPYEDRLYVADIKNGEIVVLDKATGSVLKKFGQQGESNERLHLPTNLAFDRDGILYVSDAGKFQIFKFDRDGHFRGTIGRHGSEPGAFARPRGVAIDRENRLYAVDAAFENIQTFTTEGQLLLFFGKASRGPGGMYLPARVAVDYEHRKYFEKYVDPKFEVEYLLFVTNQFGDRMVNVYAYGKEKGKKYPNDEEIVGKLKERFRKGQSEKPAREEERREERKPLLPMRIRTTILACCMTTVLLCACNATKNHKALSFFFDGVPEPGKAPAELRRQGQQEGERTRPGHRIQVSGITVPMPRSSARPVI